MLELLYQISADTYLSSGSVRKEKDEVFTFDDFKDASFPLPRDGKNVIFLCCTNMNDGVGDYSHLKNYIKWVKELVGEHYQIQPILKAHIPSSSNTELLQIITERQKHVRKDFQQFCAQEGLRPIIYEENHECIGIEQDELSELLNKSAAMLLISIGSPLHKLIKDRKGFFPVICRQLGRSHNERTLEKAYQSGSMNIDVTAHLGASYGLDIEKGLPSLQSLAKELTTFESETGQILVKQLLGEEILIESAQSYLTTHKFMPGYPQSKWAALSFILTGINKNACNNKLQNNCDFFLPKKVIDPDEILYFLEKMGIEAPIEIVTPDGNLNIGRVSNPEDKHKIRIFTSFYVSDKEYEALYRLRTDLGLGSGDNTGAKVISNSNLPFFEQKSGGFSDFVRWNLIDGIKAYIDQTQDPDLKRSLTKLKKFLVLPMDIYLKFELEGTVNNNSPSSVDQNNLEKLKHNITDYLDIINQITELAKDPEVEDAWQYFQTELRKYHCYHDHFPSILAGALYLNNPHPTASINGKTSSLHDWVPEQFIRKHQALQIWTKDELDILINPAIVKLLKRGIEIEDILLTQKISEELPNSFIIGTFVWIIKDIEKQTGATYSQVELKNYLKLISLRIMSQDDILPPNQKIEPKCEQLPDKCIQIIDAMENLQLGDPTPQIEYILNNIAHDEQFQLNVKTLKEVIERKRQDGTLNKNYCTNLTRVIDKFILDKSLNESNPLENVNRYAFKFEHHEDDIKPAPKIPNNKL
ncbi:hypothetical protein [Legionella shakespearei]|uniref:Uncharacterized protein n=1 Tax=Legionella shakespearei DSM 23087 TaxID=1122169 RepID=A0A0W0YRY9_9GAMM|nr:hypothetical protein [Legionella shakespearei]KTD59299.1 hypothetical protein Lsha_1995 [Legionella shakespearei DSM 23087]